jgi:Ni/Co efflux regulator RcnB
MKRLSKMLLAAVAASVMAVPMANAQLRPDGSRQAPYHTERYAPPRWQPAPRYNPAPQYRPAPHYQAAPRYKPAPRHWKKGERMSDWRSHAPIRDYGRYGLRRPPAGQQWVKVDNDYVLLGIATGLITSIIAGR